ncbi:MAG: hypothetical protein U0638_10305 [Phycisphaerales bacterium]
MPEQPTTSGTGRASMWDSVILLRAQFSNWTDAHHRWARELRAPSGGPPADNLTIDIESRLLAWRTTWRTLAHNPELCGRIGFMGGGHAAGIYGGHTRAMILALIRRVLGLDLVTRLTRALNRSSCPECGYDLRGGDTRPLALLALARPKCPECGVDWPLVPPPSPEVIWRHRPGPEGSD